MAGASIGRRHPAVTRNGYHQKRDLLTVCESVPVRVPRLRTRDGEPFASTRRWLPLPPALPWLHLLDMSQGTRRRP